MRGVTKACNISPQFITNFYSHTSCEVWPIYSGQRITFLHFYSHTSCEVWLIIAIHFNGFDCISTHTPHARCDDWTICLGLVHHISTHTPHARCDAADKSIFKTISISTHTPHARCDHNYWQWNRQCHKFLLTHLMRGVTDGTDVLLQVSVISTHTPHARCDGRCQLMVKTIGISTHTPHARCDR